MHLLVCTDCFLPRWDGIARFLDDILGDLDAKVTVIAPKFPGAMPDTPFTVHRIPLSSVTVGDFQFAKSADTVVAKAVQHADVVWTHTIGPIGAAGIAQAVKANKPVASFIHSLEWELAPKSLSAKNPLRFVAKSMAQRRAFQYYSQSSLLMVPSTEVQELFHYKNITTPSSIVRIGTRTDRFCPPANKAEAKRAVGIDPDKQVIGYVGRLSREKDIETLLRAFRSIKSSSSAVLLVVGDGLPAIKAQLRHPRIVYAGRQDNVIPFLQAMDMYVLPSHTETTSLSTIEAMACGVVPVCTPVGLVKSYVQEKVNGLFFPMSNYYVLSLKLKWLLESEDVRSVMAKKARQTIIDMFNWETTVAKVQQTLNGLANR